MPPGGKRAGAGAKPGVPRKTLMRFDLLETLRAKGFDPVAALLDVHERAIIQHEKRLYQSASGFGAQGYLMIARESAKDIMEFVYPKRKAVELTGAEGRDFFSTFGEIAKAVLAKNNESGSQ